MSRLGTKESSRIAALRWIKEGPPKTAIRTAGKRGPHGTVASFSDQRDARRFASFCVAVDASMMDIVELAIILYLDQHYGQAGELLPDEAHRRLDRALWPRQELLPEAPQPNGASLDRVLSAVERLEARLSQLEEAWK